MAFLKKINDQWQPSERPNWQVNEVWDFPGPYQELVKSGMAVLVDEFGNELELPGQKLVCPICFTESEGITSFVTHVTDHAAKTNKNLEQRVDAAKEAQKTEEEAHEALRAKVEKALGDEKKLTFGQRMAAARAAKQAERKGKK